MYLMSDWLSAGEVMMRLRLKPQTLYAYVSRGLIEAKADDEDSRRSLYRAAEVELLPRAKSRGRRRAAIAEDAIPWGDLFRTLAAIPELALRDGCGRAR